MSNRMGRVLGVAAAAAIGFAGLGTARAESLEFRIATLAPPGSGWMKGLEKGAQALEQETSGRVKIKYYGGAVQGDERDAIRKMKLGGLDGVVVTGVGLAMIDKSIRILEMPRMFDSIEEMDYVREKMWPYFQKRFEAKGYVLGAPADVGWVYFMSRDPVKSMADLQKTKAWMWTDDKVVRTMFEKLKVSGVPLGVPDVLPSLQSGRIDACYGPPLAAMAFQWNTKIKYMTSMPMSYSVGSTVLRKDVYEKMAAGDQAIEKAITDKLGVALRKNIRRDNNDAQLAMTRKGVKVITTPAAMIAAFDKAAEEAWSDLVDRIYTQKQLDLVLKYRAQYREKHGK